jgi:hypothetical protein
VLTNNIIADNSGWLGGIYIYIESGSTDVVNNNIAETADITGGDNISGIYLDLDNAVATANLFNNIVWGNSSPSGVIFSSNPLVVD